MNFILIGKGSILFQIAKKIQKNKYHSIKLIFWDKNDNNKNDKYYIENLKKSFKLIPIKNINSKNNLKKLLNLSFDFILSINNTQIFKKETLDFFPSKIINYHFSLIPSYKGLYSCTKVILRDEKYTGISWHYVTEEIDKGNIVFQKKLRVNKLDNAATLIIKLNKLCERSISGFLKNLKIGVIKSIKNTKFKDFKLGVKAEKYSKISVNMTADKIINTFRAFSYSPFESPLPPVKIKIFSEYKVKRVTLLKKQKFLKNNINKISKNRFIIRSSDNKCLLISTFK